MKSEIFYQDGFALTYDRNFPDPPYSQDKSEEYSNFLGNLFIKVQDNPPGMEKELQAYIKQYPEEPILRNYLVTLYQVQRNFPKAWEQNEILRLKFPKYLFGLIFEVEHYLKKERLDKVERLLGKEMRLDLLYPERKVYHTDEYLNFYYLVAKYYLQRKELEQAEKIFEKLEQVNSEHQVVKHLENLLMYQRMEIRIGEITKSGERRKEYTYRDYDKSIQTEETPQFQHLEIENLYQNGLKIPEEKLDALLSLPRASLQKDLEKVLEDAIRRYKFYEKEQANGKLAWETAMSFSLHALFLLGEIKAESSLPTILEFFRQGEDFIEFHLGDHITETIWQPIYHIGFSQPIALKDFVLEHEVHFYGRFPFLKALRAIAYFHPDRRDEILLLFEEMLTHYWESRDQSDMFHEFDMVDLISGQIGEGKFAELKPQLKACFEAYEVPEFSHGTWEELSSYIDLEMQEYEKPNLDGSIKELYHRITNSWRGYADSILPSEGEENLNKEIEKPPTERDQEWISTERQTSWERYTQTTVRREGKKIGRNDPCPCGSGKKYKKCCLQ